MTNLDLHNAGDVVQPTPHQFPFLEALDGSPEVGACVGVHMRETDRCELFQILVLIMDVPGGLQIVAHMCTTGKLSSGYLGPTRWISVVFPAFP